MDELKTFIVSSSLPIFGLTMYYNGMAFKKANRPQSVPFELFPLFVPLLFGIFGIINTKLVKLYGDNYSLIIGGLFGLLLSFIGRFILNLPLKIFKFTENNAYKVHFIAFVLYATLFRLILTPINNLFK